MDTTMGEPGYMFWSSMGDVLFFNTLGAVLCLYALHVELRKEKDPGYKALCDIGANMSCSRVLTSEYSQGFGVMHVFFGKNHILNSRNCNMGLVVYIVNILMCLALPTPLAASIMYYSCIVNVLGCVYLAVILFFVLKDVCLVCLSMYAINGSLLYLTYNMHTFYH